MTLFRLGEYDINNLDKRMFGLNVHFPTILVYRFRANGRAIPLHSADCLSVENEITT
ncbi:hypothetical protein L4D15_03485 [Enterovibrio norvegicus]|nr:hypothetical protein [Enterovibrio norvegicus]MCC4800330.1 hypothetical protein [Enterovibrio norvegicus]